MMRRAAGKEALLWHAMVTWFQVAKGSLLQAQVEMYKRLEKAAGEDAEVGDFHAMGFWTASS